MSHSILRLATAILIGFSLASCTFNQGKALTAADAARLKGAKLLVVSRDDKPLICPVISVGTAAGQAMTAMATAAVVSTTTGMSPGAAGGFVAGTSAQAPTMHGKNYGVIPNPMMRVGKSLADVIVEQHGAQLLPGVHICPSVIVSPRTVSKQRPDADFAVLVHAACGANFLVRNPTRYYINGYIGFQLLDLKNRKLIANGFLDKPTAWSAGGSKPNAHKSSDLLSPGSKTFENWMNDLVAEAMPQFKSKLAGQ